MYIDLTEKLGGGKQCGISLPVAFWAIDEQEVLDKKEESKIIGTKGKVVKVWTLHLVPFQGISIDLRFESNEAARLWLQDNIINA